MVRGSPLWNNVWAAWEAAKEVLVWVEPTSREQVLAMPLVHFPHPWQPQATEFLQRYAVVNQLWSNRLRALRDCWYEREARWYTVDEFMGYGLSNRIAQELVHHLHNHLKLTVVQAMTKVLRGHASSWVADENLALPNHPLDSTLQVTRVTNGVEYVVDENTWRLSPAPVPEGEDPEMAFPVEHSHPILVLYNLYKNRWMLQSEMPSNPTRQASLCWFELEALQRLVVDPAMWAWMQPRGMAGGTGTVDGTRRSLFNYVLADIYKALVLRTCSLLPSRSLGINGSSPEPTCRRCAAVSGQGPQAQS